MADEMMIVIRVVFWVGLGATCYAYILYPVLLGVLSRLMGKGRFDSGGGSSDDGGGGELPSVTMVLSVYNDRAVLPEVIANLGAIEYPADKISFVIGSDGSNDGTAGVLREIKDERFKINAVQLLEVIRQLMTPIKMRCSRQC